MSVNGIGDLEKWLQVAQAIVAIIGLPVLTLTLLMIWRQAKYAHHAAMSQVYQNTANDFASLQRYFMEHPEYRSYFYDGKGIDASDPASIRGTFGRDPFTMFIIRAQYCSASRFSIQTGIQRRYIGCSWADRLPCALKGFPSRRMFAPAKMPSRR
jgi:hypothetical protein